MYLDYWKLAQRPFDERIDPEWFFSSGVHQGVSIQMQAIVQRRQPIAMLVGGVGSGKSMIAANLARDWAKGKRNPDMKLFALDR